MIFEGVSADMVNAIRGNSSEIPWSIARIVADIKLLLANFVAWDFIHVFRSVNFVAHNLAVWAFRCSAFGPFSISCILDWVFSSVDRDGTAVQAPRPFFFLLWNFT